MLRKLTENPRTIQDIAEEDKDLLSPFLRFTQAKNLPVDESFLRLLIDDINALTMRFKYMFNRPRPKQLAAQKDLELVAHDGSSAHSPSYPSGHAVAGRVLSRALADRYPDFADDFERIGAAIGLNRLIAGLHYPTDHAAGIMLADQIYNKGLVRDYTNFMIPESEDLVRAVQAAVAKHAEGFNLNKSIDDMSVLVDIFKAKQKGGRLLITGGRDNEDYDVIYEAIKANNPDVVIHGGARGADRLAEKAAKELGIPTEVYIPDWDGQGKSAGFKRNAQMLAEGKPTSVIAFRGGKGTANMVKLATDAGFKVEQPQAKGDTSKRHIYVFGSNLLGVNGAGAALEAQKYGAKSRGIKGDAKNRIEGDTYSLVTKKRPDRDKYSYMTIEEIQPQLDAFAKFVADNPDMVFKVANLGMGLGGFGTPEKKKQMGEAFNNAFKAAGITRASDLKNRLHFDSEKSVGGVGLATVAFGGNLPHDPNAFAMPKERWSGTPQAGGGKKSNRYPDLNDPKYEGHDLEGLNLSDAEEAKRAKAHQAWGDDLDAWLDANDLRGGKRLGSETRPPSKTPPSPVDTIDDDEPIEEIEYDPEPEEQLPEYILLNQLSTLYHNQKSKDTKLPESDYQTQRKALEASIVDIQAQRERMWPPTPSKGGGESITVEGKAATELGVPGSVFEDPALGFTKPKDWVEDTIPQLMAAMDRSFKPTHFFVLDAEDYRRMVGVNVWDYNKTSEKIDVHDPNTGEVVGTTTQRRGGWDIRRKGVGLTVPEGRVRGTLYDVKTGEKIIGDELTEYLKQRNSPTYDAEGLSMVTLVHQSSASTIRERLNDEYGVAAGYAVAEDAELTFDDLKNWIDLDQRIPPVAGGPRISMNTAAASISHAGGRSFDVTFETSETLDRMKGNIKANLRELASGYSYAQQKQQWYEETPEAGEVIPKDEQQFDREGQGEKVQELRTLLDTIDGMVTTAKSTPDFFAMVNLIQDKRNDMFEPVLRGTGLTFMQGKQYAVDDPQYDKDMLEHIDTMVNPMLEEMAEMEENDRIDRVAAFREKYKVEIAGLTGNLNADDIDEKVRKKERGQIGRFEDRIDEISSWGEGFEKLETHLIYSALVGHFSKADYVTGEPTFYEGNRASFIRLRMNDLKKAVKKGYHDKYPEPGMIEPKPPEETVGEFTQRIQANSLYETDEKFREDADRALVELENYWDEYDGSSAKAAWDEYNNRPELEGENGILANMDRDILENTNYFISDEEGGVPFNKAGIEIYKHLFLTSGETGTPLTRRWNQVVRRINNPNDYTYDPKSIADREKAPRPNLSTNPVYKNDLDVFAALFGISGMDDVFPAATGENPNHLRPDGMKFFRSGNFAEYAPLISGLGERKRELIQEVESKHKTTAELEELKPDQPLAAFKAELKNHEEYGENQKFTDDADDRIQELEEAWERYDNPVAGKKEALDKVDETLLEEFYEKARNTKFKTTYPTEDVTLGEISGRVEVIDEAGQKELQNLSTTDLHEMIGNDFVGAVGNAADVIMNDDGTKTLVPLFSKPGAAGGVRKVTRNKKLRMFSIQEQGIERHLIEQEKQIIKSFFPHISDSERYGDFAGADLEGADRILPAQSLEAQLDVLRNKHFGEEYEDTREDEIAPITAAKYKPYLDELIDLCLQIRDGEPFEKREGMISTVPESVTREDPAIAERYKEAQHKASVTKTGRERGEIPKGLGEKVDVEAPIEDAQPTGFGLAPQRTDLPIKETVAERDPDPSYGFFEGDYKSRIFRTKRGPVSKPQQRQLPFDINEPFDPKASVPTEEHDTVEKGIMASGGKPAKRVKHTTASIERATKPLPIISDTPDNRAKIAADREAAGKGLASTTATTGPTPTTLGSSIYREEQGTEDVT